MRPVAAAGRGAGADRKTRGDTIGAGGGYDGAWTFESTTTAGNCPTLVPVDVVVQGGRVVSANSGASSPWGYVETDGTFVANSPTRTAMSRAPPAGSRTSGTGAWSSGTDYCGGAWRAHRGEGGKAAR